MTENRTASALTRLLHAGDPAAGDPGLDPSERVAMRRLVLEAGRSGRRQPAGWLLPATAAMALLALTLGLAVRQPPPALPRSAEPARPAAEAAIPAGRQIQFTTANNTLVVWVLQPRADG